MKVVMSGNGNGTKVRWDELLGVLTTTQRKTAVCVECGATKSVKYIRNGYTYCNRCALFKISQEETN